MKWFDAAKGFGFVLVGTPARDAFLHMATLQKMGQGAPVQGDRITCELSVGPKGLQVETVLSVERIGDAPADDPCEVLHMVGRVKFYDAAKGYGFVVDVHGTEVFIGSKMLHKFNLEAPCPEQRVMVSAVRGSRGFVADTLSFIA